MALGRPLTRPERSDLCNYMEILLKWQRTHRLVASNDPGWIAEHLLADSLLFLKVFPVGIRTVIDIGSGAGFPGIPLKIARTDISVTLVESRQRRASFLRGVVRELGLAEVQVVDQRLEAMSPMGAGADVATMRCAGEPRRLLTAALRLVRPGGIVVASGPPAEELSGERPARRYRDSDVGEPAFERVLVPGLYGRARQFLVARKS